MKRIIAIDFDGTIVDHRFPEIGKLKPHARRVINKWYDNGTEIIIWTCRNNSDPECGPLSDTLAVRKFLEENGVKYTTINEQAPAIPFRLHAPKVFADLYIDDRNVGGFPGWQFIEKAVEAFYEDGDWRRTYLEYDETRLFDEE